jgi:hypothetical protein
MVCLPTFANIRKYISSRKQILINQKRYKYWRKNPISLLLYAVKKIVAAKIELIIRVACDLLILSKFR